MFKEKLMKLLAAKKEQRERLNQQLIESDNKEERAEIGETLKTLATEIADVEEMLKDVDEPANGSNGTAGGDAGAGDGANGEGARGFKPMATVAKRDFHSAGDDGRAELLEKRAEEFARTDKMRISAGETRSTLISTGQIAKPTSVGGINDPFNTVSSIVDMVRVEDMTGMGGHKEAYITKWQTASAKTDGTAQTATDPTFKTVAINPFLMGCLSYVSRELKKQTPLQYEQKVREGAMIALRKKLAGWIVSGGGTNEIYGIINAVNTDTSPASMIQTLDMTAAIGADTLRKIVFAYGGDENIGGGAVLYLNKADLIAFGDVRGTNEKKAVYEITPDGDNPNTGIIKDGGLLVRYCICSDVTAYSSATGTSSGVKTMIYGSPLNYKLGLFGDFEVNVSDDYKFAEGLLTVRGEVMVGGNVIVDKGFVVLNKKSASG